MATLREYYDTDIKTMNVAADWELHDQDGVRQPNINARVHQEFDANAKFMSFWIPEEISIGGVIRMILSSPAANQGSLDPGGDDGVEISAGMNGYENYGFSKELIYTRRLFFYIDSELAADKRELIRGWAEGAGFKAVVRDREYARKRAMHEIPLAFISHDSRDKDSLVRKLAQQMSGMSCPVWYDEYSLGVGDSLRQSIERGLKETKKCVVILSPNFFSNTGWGRAEFDSVYTREIIERDNVILPVWHGVTVQQVYEYSPRLADKVGLNSDLGVEELARRLAAAVLRAT